MSTRSLHVVFGAGQVGPPLARQLRDRGHRVRIVRRSGGDELDGIAVMRGDAGDPAFAAAASREAAVIYHCMNPPYDARIWERELPRIMRSLIGAAGQSGARLVVLDNLYMLGRPHGRPISEDNPVAPVSRKGKIRARVAELLFEAHRRGDVQAVSGRASDFYGPGGVGTYFGEPFWSRVLAGRGAQLLTAPDIPHSWHFIPDVAAGLAALGEAGDDAYGRWWMLPVAPAATLREMVARFASVLGREVPVERVPSWIMSAMGLFIPILRELREMTYQFEEPFVADDRRFRARFGLEPTIPEEGARATVAWARETFGSKEAGRS